MNHQNLHSLNDSPKEAEEADSKRPKSKIEFPYGDLDTGIDVAKMVFKIGGQQCFIHQLASWLGHGSLTSGAFRFKFTTARIFGLIEADNEAVKLTELGRRIIDENFERQARVDAFLHVPLYKALFNKYKGFTLPADIGLENEIVELGVTPKQKDKARQAFQRSALQAGFFEQGRTKLVLPSGSGILSPNNVSHPTIPLTPIPTPTPSIAPSSQYDHGGSGGGGNSSGIPILQEHPLIQGLFEELAPLDTPWTQEQHDEWIELARVILKRIHPLTK